MSSISQKALTTQELGDLAKFLEASHEDAKPMNLTEAHGFLSAIISAPTMLMPSQWQPLLLGGHPEFQSMEEATTIMELISRFYNQIGAEIRDETDFIPLLYENGKHIAYKEGSFGQVSNWCKGYLAGTRQDEIWMADQYGVGLILPFGVLSGKFSVIGQKDADGQVIEDDTNVKQQMKDAVPAVVKDLYEYWQQARQNPTPISREPYKRTDDKVGRNDQCPCGSGLKFKKCCGKASTGTTYH